MEILTDKASVEIPSFVEGTVESLKAKVGDMIEVGQTLMTIKLSQKSSQKLVQQTTKTHKKTPQPTVVNGTKDIPTQKIKRYFAGVSNTSVSNTSVGNSFNKKDLRRS